MRGCLSGKRANIEMRKMSGKISTYLEIRLDIRLESNLK